MPPNARVWVYQNNKLFSDAETIAISLDGNKFIANWAAHGADLKASFDILHNLFIVIAVDEQQAMASGCSIDKLVQFIKSIEQKFQLNLFDRMLVAYRNRNEIKICSISEFEKLAAQKLINENTIVFNNMVSSKSAFDKEWEGPLKSSWQKRILV